MRNGAGGPPRPGRLGGRLNLFFGPLAGVNQVDVRVQAIASQMALSEAAVMPMALRNNANLGPVDPTIADRNPGKDGPSYPTWPTPDDPNAYFKIGDQVTIALYGKGPKAPVHLTRKINPNPADTHKILGGDLPAPTVKVGDEYEVFNDGSGASSFIEALDDRVERTCYGDPSRIIIVPVVETLAGSRDASGQLSGKVRVVDFVAVRLDAIEEVDAGWHSSPAGGSGGNSSGNGHTSLPGTGGRMFAMASSGNGNNNNNRKGSGNSSSSSSSRSSSGSGSTTSSSGNGNGSGGSSSNGSGNGGSPQGNDTIRRLVGTIVKVYVTPTGYTRGPVLRASARRPSSGRRR